MRVPSLGNAARAAAVSVLLSAALGSVSADVGGGKGYPATPWRRSVPKSVQDIEKAKAVAAEYQSLSIPGELVDKTRNDLFHLNRVSLRAEEPREGDTVGYALVGKSGSGETVSLSFSQIESFVVTARKDKTIMVSVAVWPDISPKELIEKQPTYKQLTADYRRTVILEMSLRSADGRPLVFAGEYGPTLPLEKLTVGIKGNFYGEPPYMVHPLRFWWAIPSVANDADYPYRIIPLD
jgi:hypothetical protein